MPAAEPSQFGEYVSQVVILDDNGKLKQVVAAHDVGHAINPKSCAGQIEGGVHMGLGYALSEDFTCTGAVPDSLASAYGTNRPVGGFIFIGLQPPKMSMGHEHHMSGM